MESLFDFGSYHPIFFSLSVDWETDRLLLLLYFLATISHTDTPFVNKGIRSDLGFLSSVCPSVKSKEENDEENYQKYCHYFTSVKSDILLLININDELFGGAGGLRTPVQQNVKTRELQAYLVIETSLRETSQASLS
jgi:hypothetical protein